MAKCTAIVADNEPETDAVSFPLEDGGDGVEPDAFWGGFTADMNQPTINQSTFRVIDASGQDVEGTLAYDPQTRQVTFTPKHSYTYDETYTLIITNGILDRDGRHLDQNLSFRFTIKADNDRPVIIARSPLAENGPAPSNSTIIIRFNEPLARLQGL